MPLPTPSRRLWPRVAALGLAAAAILLVVAPPAPAPASASPGHPTMQTAPPRTTNQVALHDALRAVWEDHVSWTRLAIVTFAAGSPGFDTTAARLLQNQADIGNAIRPYYGDAAADRLTALLHEHITIAVEVLAAARANDQGAFDAAKGRWYANGEAIADFLSAANPRFWHADAMRSMMAAHLDQTLSEAAHELAGDYAAGIADYERAHAHILAMADALSAGIIGQFPGLVR